MLMPFSPLVYVHLNDGIGLKLCQLRASYRIVIRTLLTKMRTNEALPRIHASKFHQPAKKPTIRPHLGPGVTLAQAYTPAEDGMAEASSAMEAATIQ